MRHVLLVDNYDSFTYNLYAYINNLGYKVFVVKNDELYLTQIKHIKPIAIVISPGPLNPFYAGVSLSIIALYWKLKPILGICLGHQLIGYLFGSNFQQGKQPVHAKSSFVEHNNDKLFRNIPQHFKCGRYHSLVVDKTHSKTLTTIAKDEQGTVMAIKHNVHEIYGLQFHPESILSDYGNILLRNFFDLCQT